MAKANTVLSISEQLSSRIDATTNHEGGLAFALDARSRLYTRAVASLIREDKFYTSAEQCDAELVADIQAVAEVDPEFVLRLAAFTRQVMNIRSTPVAMLVQAAAIPACKPFVRRWTPAIVQRVDEITEVIAYWTICHGAIGSAGAKGGEHAFPNSLTRGLQDALGQFDEYQFAKYDREGRVTLRDALRILRPTPVGEAQSALFRYLVKGTVDAEHLPKLAAKAVLLRKETLDAEALELADTAHVTHEVLTSKFGSNAETWNAIRFLPFMAGLRNLSNIMRTGADTALDRVLSMFRNPEHVRRSRQLPFRFFSAARIIESGLRYDRRTESLVHDERIAAHPRRNEVLEALQTAVELSLVNVPRLSGRTFITADNSGSMATPLSERSTVTLREVANLMAALGHALCEDPIVSVFGSNHAVVPVSRKDTVLTNMAKLGATPVGGATNAFLTVRYLRENRIRVDRIVLFSDMQCYDSTGRRSTGYGWGEPDGSLAEELRKYRSSVNPEVFMHSVDLAGHGTSQFPQDERRVALLAGWSERLLEALPLFEAGGTQAVDRISGWQPRVQRREMQDQAEVVTEVSE
ncbi:TROVE domain-containing protein [Candidatus Uhrbacteria bacterium]|nr:TROVE domain-containing protein [Candidatus Uhrbacteria bacterium]